MQYMGGMEVQHERRVNFTLQIIQTYYVRYRHRGPWAAMHVDSLVDIEESQGWLSC